MPSTVLITGVAGFLGRYLAREFLRAGWQVIGLDDIPPENAPRGVEFHRMRLPASSFENLLREKLPQACIHAAGRASVALSLREPGADFRDSVLLTFEVLDALRRCAPTCRFLFLSSAAVYGNPRALPVAESDDAAPLSPYGWHKRQCELLVEEFHRVYALPTLSVRIFSAYGAGLRRQVVWDICERALSGGRLILHGTGEETRDFIHAGDIARALLRLTTDAPACSEIYNLATGSETTIHELAISLLKLLDLDIAPEFDGQQTPGDPRNWRAEISRMRAIGFTPTISLSNGLSDAAAWARAELAL